MMIGLVLFMLMQSANKQCPKSEAHCDSRATSAMSYMVDHFGAYDNIETLLIDGSYGASSKLRLEHRENQFERMEAWARTLQNPSDRKAWLGVIEYYEDGAKEAYREWHSHAARNHQEEWEKHQRECDRIAREAEHNKPIPKPPASIYGKEAK